MSYHPDKSYKGPNRNAGPERLSMTQVLANTLVTIFSPAVDLPCHSSPRLLPSPPRRLLLVSTVCFRV
jgi:hypothetical protein